MIIKHKGEIFMDEFNQHLQQFIGELIRYHRRQVKNISLEKMGERIKMDANNLARIERGEQSPDISTFWKIICELNINHEEYIEHIRKLYMDYSH